MATSTCVLPDPQSVLEALSRDCRIEPLPAAETVHDTVGRIIRRSHNLEAVYVVDLAKIWDRLSVWSSTLPNVQLVYAVRCNADRQVLRELSLANVLFDCVSALEVELLLQAVPDVNREHVLLMPSSKSTQAFRSAAAVGVRCVSVDSLVEFRQVVAEVPDTRIFIRLCPDRTNPDDASVGATLPEAIEIIEAAMITRSFVSGFVLRHPDLSDTAAVVNLMNLFAPAVHKVRDCGLASEPLVYVQGGIASLDSEQDCEQWSRKASHWREELLSQVTPLGAMRLCVLADRWTVRDSHALAANIFARRARAENAPTNPPPPAPAADSGHASGHGPAEDVPPSMFSYYINDGVYGSFSSIAFDGMQISPFPLRLTPSSEDTLYPCTVFGPTCDGLDCLSRFVTLPKLEIGDWLYFLNMGAYTRSNGTSFNGFDPPRVEYVWSETAQ